MRRLTGHLGLLGWLTAVWVALWGELSAANVLGGLAVAVLLLLLLPLPEVARARTVRPLPLLRFVAVFLFELVRASLTVVGQVLRPRSMLEQAVISVPVAGLTDRLVTLVANAVSLTPGTLTLEADRSREVLYVHVLHLGGGVAAVDDVRRSILRMERLAVLALGSPECLRALDRATGRATGRAVRT